MTRLSLEAHKPLSTLPKSGRLSCKYPMAYKGLTDRELNLPVHIFICRSFRFYKCSGCIIHFPSFSGS